MNSIQKIQALRAKATGAPPPDATPAELTVRTLLRNAGGLLDALLPQTPADMDDLLQDGCRWLAGLRSDDAGEVVIYTDEEPVDAVVVPEPGA